MDTEPIVQLALSKLGCPYVWGATGPDTFDCSGLVVWAFKQNGQSITRVTQTQMFEGEEVVGAPQRGDLVFPDAGHVGIALGGNQMVHAPTTGDVVKISDYWTTPVAIRRFGTNSGLVGSTTVDPQFMARAGAGNLVDYIPSGSAIQAQVANLNTAVAQQIGFMSDVGKIFQAASAFFSVLVSAEGWKRILKVLCGTIALFVGIAFMAKELVGRIG